jgi:hypothetical protein
MLIEVGCGSGKNNEELPSAENNLYGNSPIND